MIVVAFVLSLVLTAAVSCLVPLDARSGCSPRHDYHLVPRGE